MPAKKNTPAVEAETAATIGAVEATAEVATDTAPEVVEEPKAALPKGHVLVRVTKSGSNRISTGLPKPLKENFVWKDEFTMPEDDAKILEARGIVEIEED
jgi:hypothetical protein